MIVKRFGCTTIHNKMLYKCIIHSFKRMKKKKEKEKKNDRVHITAKNSFWSGLFKSVKDKY